MKLSYQINAEPRNDMGKGASRRLRRTGMVPAIIYGAGEPPMNVAIQHETLKLQLQHESFYSHILSVNVAGTTFSAVMRDIQRHPAEPRILHLDLLRVREDQEIRMHVPVHFLGAANAPGVKQAGGQVMHQTVEVEVECLPKFLPEYIEVDVSNMELNDVIHLSDLKLPEGVSLTALKHGSDLPVVTIHMPRAAAEETPAATVESAAAASPAGGTQGAAS